MISNRQLIDALKQLPPDDEITLEVSGFDADGVALFVGEQSILEQDYGLNDLHFVQPPPVTGELV